MFPLTFYYGTMGSGKTARLLLELYQHTRPGHPALLLKPAVDQGDGMGTVASRITGLRRRADIVQDLKEPLDVAWLQTQQPNHLYVEEAQWLSASHVDQLVKVAATLCPVSCYGLRTDFRLQLFPGSAALFAVASDVVEIPLLCELCQTHKAVANQMVPGGHGDPQGSSVQPAKELYRPVCLGCFRATTDVADTTSAAPQRASPSPMAAGDSVPTPCANAR